MWVMVSVAHQPLWTGLIQHTPWWWAFVMQIEKRLDSLRETAAYDPDHEPPPKDLWPVARAEELEAYLEQRRKEGDKRTREKQPLDNWG